METQEKGSGIVHKAESWKVPGVFYKGRTETYEVVGEMTETITQDKLVEKYGLEIPSIDLILAIASRAYEMRDENPLEAESLRLFLRVGLRAFPNTSTRIIYEPSGEDRIIHNYRTSNEYSIQGSIVGPNNWISEIPNKKILESLLGTNNVSQINSVSQWVNRTNSFIWRLNSKPKEKEEMVAGFTADDNRLLFLCDGDPLDEYPAFRVLKVE